MEPDARDSAFRDWLASKQARRRLSLGVSFRNFDVHGFVSSTRFQPTVVSFVLGIPEFFANLLCCRRAGRVQILRDFDGLVRSGEMLLVLGRPGSGCTTMLKALAGDTHGIYVGVDSRVNYEGISYEQMHRDFKGESVYLAELDIHMPELTVGQTLTFAASTRETGPDRAAVSRAQGRSVATLFDLGTAFDTPVGNTAVRGISGGEKRRTSLAEAIVGNAQLQCWDNSTRGLDSATAQRFIEFLRKSSTALRTTVAMSIYQASEGMYKNFDKVTVLYEGRQIYFGPVDAAANYFHELGFTRPLRATTPDFLTSLTNPAERIVREGWEGRAPRSPDEFAAAWKQSAEAKALFKEIDQFDSANPVREQRWAKQDVKSQDIESQDNKLGYRSATFVIPIYLQIVICLQRGFRRLRNNPAAPISMAVASGVLALILGSAYFNLPVTTDSMDRRSVVIFFSLMITALSSPAFEVLAIWAQRPIVEKQNRYAFYHPSAESAASMMCDLPAKLVTAAFFQTTIYFMTNLRRTAAAFFTWFLVNFVLVLTMSMWFRLLGSVARRREHTMAPSGIITSLCVIYIGYVVPVPYMVGWLEWFRRLNPLSYAFESLMINEFCDREFLCVSAIPSGDPYTTHGLDGRICPQIGALAGEDFVQGSKYLVEKYSYEASHKWRNVGILLAMTAIVGVLHMVTTQYIPAQRFKGDVIRFQKHASKRRRVLPADAESYSPVAFAQDINKQLDFSRRGSNRTSEQVIERQSTVYHWNSLSYDVKTPGGTKRILNNVDGWVKPGTLTALMGVTGAGKTTLLDVLADRATAGTITGNIYVDGLLRDASFRRKMGYVQQDDIHVSTATVREALEFSAMLRQPSEVSYKEKRGYVDKVIKVLDMTAFADAVVGVPGDGLNVEQRKRLTIGVELVAKPEILLFLDEPTSGMDSQTAWSICTLLRKLADNGQAVLCTIHQPSAQLFCMFDRILLLNSQGETIYFGDIGPNASTMVSYFERNGAPKCPPDANPAEWVMKVTSDPASSADQADSMQTTWFKTWCASREKKEVLHHLAEIRVFAKPADQSEYATKWMEQLCIVGKRLFQEYWRDPAYVYTKVILCAGMALLNGLSFQNSPLDVQGLTNIVFSMFLVTQLFSILNQQIILRYADGMALFEARERQAKTYSWTVFLAANLVVEVVWQTVAAALIFVAWYFPTGIWRHGTASFGGAERGGLTVVLIWLFCLWCTTVSQAFAAGIKNTEVAFQLTTLFFWFSLVFCGVLVRPDQMPRFWMFMYRVSPLTYFIRGLSLAGLADNYITCSAGELLHINPPAASANATCGDYLAPYINRAGGSLINPEEMADCQYCQINSTNRFLESFGVDTGSSAWENAGYLAVYVVVDIVAILAFYWLARIPRKFVGAKRS